MVRGYSFADDAGSSGVDATVDVERGAGDEAVVLAGEKHGGTRNISAAMPYGASLTEEQWLRGLEYEISRKLGSRIQESDGVAPIRWTVERLRDQA